MADRKMITTKFGDVPKELYDKIPSIKEHLKMVTANRKLIKLRADLQALHKNIQKYSTEDDAERLLAGESLEETKVTDRQELNRKRETLERAIELQKFEIQKLEIRLIREGLKELEPLARKYVKESLDNLAAAEKALTRQTELFVILRMRGYKRDYLPAKWRIAPLELQLLRGGAFPSLALFLQEKRKVWGFKAVGPHIKK